MLYTTSENMQIIRSIATRTGREKTIQHSRTIYIATTHQHHRINNNKNKRHHQRHQQHQHHVFISTQTNAGEFIQTHRFQLREHTDAELQWWIWYVCGRYHSRSSSVGVAHDRMLEWFVGTRKVNLDSLYDGNSGNNWTMTFALLDKHSGWRWWYGFDHFSTLGGLLFFGSNRGTFAFPWWLDADWVVRVGRLINSKVSPVFSTTALLTRM